MDRWVNAGGKRAVVIAKSMQEGVPSLQRRNGKILRPDLPELRYHQFNLGSGSRTAGTITVYHIFSPLGMQTAALNRTREQIRAYTSQTDSGGEDPASTTSEDESDLSRRRNPLRRTRRPSPKRVALPRPSAAVDDW